MIEKTGHTEPKYNTHWDQCSVSSYGDHSNMLTFRNGATGLPKHLDPQ